MIAKVAAVFWKESLTAFSYRAAFLMQFAAPLLMIASFFFIGRLLENAHIPGLDRYGGDYFAFVIVGLVFITYAGIAIGSVASTTRRGQMSGTLEAVLTTQTGLATLLAGSYLYAVTRGTLNIAIFLAVGALFLGVSFVGADVLAGTLILLLSTVVMLGLGILSGSFILLLKQGDPVSLLVNAGAFLLSGVAYPVEVLPGWLQVGSKALPHTYALEGLRLALLQGESIAHLTPQITALALYGIIVVPVSLLVFNYAVHRVRIEGSFAQF